MRNGIKSVSAAAVLAFIAGSASAQNMVVDTALGTLPLGSSVNLTGTWTGTEGGEADAYAVASLATFLRTYVDNEFVFSFTTTAPAEIAIVQNTPPTVTNFVRFFLLDSLQVEETVLDVGTFPTALSALDGLVNEGAFGGEFPAGNYFISVDAFTGAAPIVPAAAAGSFDVQLTVNAFVADTCGSAGGPAVAGNLGAVAGTVALIGDTSDAADNVCGYRDGVGGPFFGFLAEFNEEIFQFSLAADNAVSITNIEGIFVGIDHDHYLLDGLGFTAGFDLFGDGSFLGTVSDDAIGFLDEEGSFGAQVAGTYFLSIDGFDGNGAYDLDLTVAPPATCGTGNGPVVDGGNAGLQTDGSVISFIAADTTGLDNNICGYRGADLFFVGFTAFFNESITQFSTDAGTGTGMNIAVVNIEGAGVGIDHDHYLIDGLAFTTGFDLFGDGTLFGDVSDNALAVVDEDGSFGIFPNGTYFISIDGFDGDGIFDIDVTFTSVNLISETIDPATECTELGEIGTGASPVTISMCGLTDDTVDTLMGVFDRNTGTLIAINDDGCAFFGPSTFDNLFLPEGDYVLSIGSFPSDGVNPFSNGLNHDISTALAVAGNIDFNGVSTQPFATTDNGRAVFCFSIGAGVIDPPAAVDLGEINADELNIINIDTCGAVGLDTEIGVWDDQGVLAGSNDDSAFCTGSNPPRQSAIGFDFSDAMGEFDPAFDGIKLYFSVSGFNTVFASGFSAAPAAGSVFGAYAGNVNDVTYSGTFASQEVDFFCFTVRPPAPTFPGCNPADLSPEFGTLDINDILIFAGAFNNNDPIADFSAEFGTFDINDILIFAGFFNAGCP